MPGAKTLKEFLAFKPNENLCRKLILKTKFSYTKLMLLNLLYQF